MDQVAKESHLVPRKFILEFFKELEWNLWVRKVQAQVLWHRHADQTKKNASRKPQSKFKAATGPLWNAEFMSLEKFPKLFMGSRTLHCYFPNAKFSLHKFQNNSASTHIVGPTSSKWPQRRVTTSPPQDAKLSGTLKERRIDAQRTQCVHS